MFYRFLQHSFWLRPALSLMTRSRAVGVVAGTGAVEASTAAPPEWEAFTEVESMPVAWAVGTASRVARVTGEGIIHVADTDTVRRRWGPQRLVPRPTAPTALTTTATTRTATISAPANIDIDARRVHPDGGWASPYRRPFLFAPRFNFKAA